MLINYKKKILKGNTLLSERIQSLKDIILNLEEIKKYVPLQIISYNPNKNKSPILRHAEAYAQVFKQVSVNHLPGEMIVCNVSDKLSTRPNHILDEEKQKIRSYPKNCSEELLIALEEEMFYIWPFSDGHMLPDYQKVLKKGLGGVIEELKTRLKDPGLSKDQKEFLEASLIEWNAFLDYVQRHYDYFKKLESESKNESEKKYFSNLAEICLKVPLNPASSFHEALQTIWFTHIATQIDDVSNHSLGRLDQYLYPYYIEDIKKGVLTKKDARELFFEFWLKFNIGYKISEEEGIRLEGQGIEDSEDVRNGHSWLKLKAINNKHLDDGQTIDICGLDRDNLDATNEISWLMLDALNEFRTFEPKPVIKYTKKTDKAFMQKCYEILASGLGLPAISYHEAGARGLRSYEGLFTEEDIINHSHIGCVELGIPGKSYTDPMNGFVNLPKIVLVTMKNGYYNGRMVGKVLQPATTWQKFFNNFDEQLNYFIGLYVKGMNDSNPFYSQYFSRPLISAIVENCIEKAVPVDNGGAKYWVKCINCIGLATAVDSMYTIKKLVYDDKQFSIEALNDMLINNYDNKEDLRQMIKNRLPKYGNGVEEVDNIAKKLVEQYSKFVRNYRTFNGNRFRPGLYSFYEPIKRMGKVTCATPDGRKAGDVFSLNCAPGHGSIKNGLSSVLRSITSFDHSLADNASAVDVHLSPGVTSDVIRYINEYLANKNILYTQFTVANQEDMQKAQINPEQFQDLIVRVTGFSARFISLDKETQNEIIQRSFWV